MLSPYFSYSPSISSSHTSLTSSYYHPIDYDPRLPTGICDDIYLPSESYLHNKNITDAYLVGMNDIDSDTSTLQSPYSSRKSSSTSSGSSYSSISAISFNQNELDYQFFVDPRTESTINNQPEAFTVPYNSLPTETITTIIEDRATIDYTKQPPVQASTLASLSIPSRSSSNSSCFASSGSSYSSAAASSSSSSSPSSCSSSCLSFGLDDVLTPEADHLLHFLMSESTLSTPIDYLSTLQSSLSVSERHEVVHHIYCLNNYCSYQLTTYYTSLSCFDRILSTLSIKKRYLQLVACICVMLSAKMYEDAPLTSAHIYDWCNGRYTMTLIAAMEKLVFERLDWKISSVSPYTALTNLLAMFPITTINHDRVFKLLAQLHSHYGLILCKSSLLAVALVVTVHICVQECSEGDVWLDNVMKLMTDEIMNISTIKSLVMHIIGIIEESTTATNTSLSSLSAAAASLSSMEEQK